MSVVLIVFLNYSNINPSVLFFNNSFFIKAFLEKKKKRKRKLLAKKHTYTTIFHTQFMCVHDAEDDLKYSI